MNKTIEVTFWNNGKEGYGIKLKDKDDRDYFPKNGTVIVFFDDNNDINFFNISYSFMKKLSEPCPELRSQKFKIWADKHDLKIGDKAVLKIIKPKEEFRLRTI